MRIGVIGAAGKIGQLRVQTIRENPETSLAAVMDMDQARASAVAQGAPAFDDLERFLDCPMDAVVISTPAHVREPLCLAAFKRDLHVLSEKPLTQNVASGQRVLDAAKAAGKVLGAGFNMRYYPAFSYVKDIVGSGQIGDLDHVRIYGGHDGLGQFAHEWEYQSEFSGGGALWDVGIHMTDMARHILGEITSVYGIATNRVWNVEGSEDNALAIFRNPEGIAAIYQASWIEWKGYKSAIEVYGSKGMVRGVYAPMQNLLMVSDRPGGAMQKTRKFYPEIIVREKVKSWKSTALLSFAAELADFVKLAQGETGLRIADGHAGLRAIEVATAVSESTRTGQPVLLDALGDMTV